jgi:hypothetical protein
MKFRWITIFQIGSSTSWNTRGRTCIVPVSGVDRGARGDMSSRLSMVDFGRGGGRSRGCGCRHWIDVWFFWWRRKRARVLLCQRT